MHSWTMKGIAAATIAGMSLALAAAGASAAPITYIFGTGNNTGLGTGNLGTTNVTVTVDGLMLDITSSPGNINRQAANGLGVQGGNADQSVGDGESLIFEILNSPGSASLLSGLIFEKSGSGAESGAGSFDLFVDDVFNQTVSWAAGGANSQVLENINASGLKYEFRGVAVDDTVAFRVTQLTFQVPEPGTLAIVGLGLVGLGIARRRRTA
jgi:hypothetical protein